MSGVDYNCCDCPRLGRGADREFLHFLFVHAAERLCECGRGTRLALVGKRRGRQIGARGPVRCRRGPRAVVGRLAALYHNIELRLVARVDIGIGSEASYLYITGARPRP